MTQIPPKNPFLEEQILEKSESKVGSDFGHPTDPTKKQRQTKIDKNAI